MIPISNIPPILDPSGNLVQQSPTAGVAPQSPQPLGPASAASDFSQTLVNAVGSLSGLQDSASQATAGIALNQGTDIHQAMIAMEQASLGMHLAVTVRDKAVEAYQTLMNMQV